MTSNKNIVIAGVAVSALGVYLSNREAINKSVETIYKEVFQSEVVTSGGSGSSGGDVSKESLNQDRAITQYANLEDRENFNDEDRGGVSEDVFNDVANFTRQANSDGRSVKGVFNEDTNRTKIINEDTGETEVIFDYNKRVSTTPELEKRAKRSSSSGGSSSGGSSSGGSSSSSRTKKQKSILDTLSGKNKQRNFSPIQEEDKEEKSPSDVLKSYNTGGVFL